MTTISDTGPLLIACNTTQSRPEIGKGKIRVTFVRYSTVEYDIDNFKNGHFKVHDANCEEAKLVAKAVAL